jgi:hypothetical protein
MERRAPAWKHGFTTSCLKVAGVANAGLRMPALLHTALALRLLLDTELNILSALQCIKPLVFGLSRRRTTPIL